MPNATIATGTAIFIGNVPLHRRQENEEENVAVVEDITKAGVGDVEDDVVGDNKIPKAIQLHAALIALGSDRPAPELQQGQVPPSVPGPNPQGARLGKLVEPSRGQLGQLRAQSGHPGRHDPRVMTRGLSEGQPMKRRKEYKFKSKEEALAARKKRRNRARKERLPPC